MEVAFDGFSSADTQQQYTELLKQVAQKQSELDEKRAQINDVAIETSVAQAQLKELQSRDGEAVLHKLDEDIAYKTSQIEFYEDGVKALERLYDLCVQDLRKRETSVAEARLENKRKTATTDASETLKRETLEEYTKVRNDLDSVLEEWNNLDGEVRLMVEKQRSATNPYIARVESDKEVLREWRKFRYFAEMVAKLKIQLVTDKQTITDHRAENLYAAVVRHKIPLDKWVSFAKEQLLKGKGETSSQMELDDETGKVHQMLQYLEERASAIQAQTFPKK